MEVKKVLESDLDALKTFIKNIPSITEVDEEILKNASIVLENNEIFGCLSFEKYGAQGLIRYFIFKKQVDDNYIKEMFNSIYEKAINDGLNNLYCIAEAQEIKNLFQTVGFVEIDKELFFIEEEAFSNYNYENASVMEKKLV